MKGPNFTCCSIFTTENPSIIVALGAWYVGGNNDLSCLAVMKNEFVKRGKCLLHEDRSKEEVLTYGSHLSIHSFFCRSADVMIFSRGHATLHLAMSVGRSVRMSVGPSVTLLNSERFSPNRP